MADHGTGTALHKGLLWRLWSWLGCAQQAAVGELTAPWTEVLADIEGGEHNLLHKNKLRGDLRIEFEPWAFSEPTPSDPDVLELFLDDNLDNPVAVRTWDAPIAADDFFIMLPQRYLSDGNHGLFYRVTIGVSGESNDSEVFTFVVDSRAPDLGDDAGRLVFPADVEAGITARYLELNQDRVTALVPEYFPTRVGDTLTWYWEQQPVGSQPLGSMILSSAELGRPLQLSFSGDEIRGNGDGLRYVTYEVIDRAGNASRLSRAVALQVDAAPLPRYWPAPQLLDSYNSQVYGTLDPLRGQSGVTVLVPANAVFYPDEIATVYWGERGSLNASQAYAPIGGSGPWRASIGKAHVASHIGQNLRISYGLRGADQLGPSTSLAIAVADIPQSSLPQLQSRAGSQGNGKVSLAALPAAGDTLSVRPWPMIATSQKLRLWAQGTASSGLPSEHWLLDGASVSAAQVSGGVAVSLPRNWLTGLRLYTPLDLHLTVSFDGGSSWKVFPTSGSLTIVP